MPPGPAHQTWKAWPGLTSEQAFVIAVLLTALDEVELPGSRMTVYNAAAIAGYAFQTMHLFILVITLLTAHQRRDWKVMSPADQSAAGLAVHQHHVVA
ncbi:g5171 [Coccomyxa elongata]